MKKRYKSREQSIKCEAANVTDEKVFLVESISDLKECVDVEIL